ncbi:MAG: flagellar motor switch protein FliN [Ilumatobacter sp.]
MTTTAPHPTDAQAIDLTDLIASAKELASSLGNEGEPDEDAEWPVTTDHRSLVADFTGERAGSVYLGLSEPNVNRLTADADTANAVVGALVGALGIDPESVEITELRPADDLPERHLVMVDDKKILGVGFSLEAVEESPVDAAGPASFEPTPINGSGASAGSMGAPISMLADVDMLVTVELGRATLPVRELLSLQPGMVVELDRQAGAPIDVLVNGRRIARGEVVVLDEQFGLRVTEIIADGAA